MRKLIIGIFILGIIFLSLIYIGGFLTNKGYYYVSEQWIGNNNSDEIKYCDKCLWIKFGEGCNRYTTYYFENQHEYDERLELGMAVDISFRKCGDGNLCIKNIVPRKEYQSKCS